jgi:2',3'-cyclic-nucleotide 2'-phosphodiesterase (5'-nucleotidase family)
VIEPCGCGGQNTGGLPRRATYIKSIQKENPNCIIVESGNLATRLSVGEPNAQLEAVADALKIIGYSVVGVGSADLNIGGDDYVRLLDKRGISVVHLGVGEINGAKPYLVKEVDGVKIGIVCFSAVNRDEKSDFDLYNRRNQALHDARQESDVLVLIDQADVVTDDWLLKNEEREYCPDVVIGSGSRAFLADAKQVGRTMVLPYVTRGTYVGRVDIQIDGINRKMTFSKTRIDASIVEDPDILAMARDYYDNQAKIISAAKTTKGTYYSHETCKSCHAEQYEQWNTTAHAIALKTLESASKVTPECVSCHNERFRSTKTLAKADILLGGVECASCHANVLPHGADNKAKRDTAAIRTACQNCHTKDRSPNFDLATAYEKIKH